MAENCTVTDKCTTDVVYFGYVYVLTLVSVLGTIFNIINLCVFRMKSFQAKFAYTDLPNWIGSC